jgi:phosphate:Na+ symporter
VANNLLEFASRRARRAGGFEPREMKVIAAMHAELVHSLRLGLVVFLRGDAALQDARRLMTRKRLLRRLELEAAGLSMPAPPTGRAAAAFEPGNVVAGGAENGDFLRIVRDLRRVHSHIAALAYPVLGRAGERDDRGAEPPSVITAETWVATDMVEPTSRSAIPPDLPAPIGTNDGRGKLD